MNLWGTIKGLLVQDETDRTKQLSVEVDPTSTTDTRMTIKSAQTADRTINIPDADDTLVGKETTDLLKNKQLEDDSTEIVDAGDNTKKIIFDASGNTATKTTITSSQTGDQTLTLPDATDTLVGRATNDDLTNKNLKSNTNLLTGAKADSFERETGNEGTLNIPDVATSDTLVAEQESQTLENKAIDGTDATGNNTITADADDITYDNSASGLTATDLQAATDEVEGRVDADEQALADHLADTVDSHDASSISYDNASSGLTATEIQAATDEVEARVDTNETDITNLGNNKADTDLNNLGTTSINQNLLPDDTANNRDIGNSVNRFHRAYFNGDILFYNGTSSLGSIRGDSGNNAIAMFATNANILLRSAPEGTADASPAYNVTIEGGNKNAGTGKGGEVKLQSGSSTGGDSGDIVLETNPTFSGSQGIIKLKDGTEGTIGHVWTSTGVNGEGEWQLAAPGGGANTSLSNLSSVAVNTILEFGTAIPGGLKTADNGAGDSEDLTIETGSATGTQGDIKLKDGSEGTAGHVWTSKGTTGEGNWEDLTPNAIIANTENMSVEKSGSVITISGTTSLSPTNPGFIHVNHWEGSGSSPHRIPVEADVSFIDADGSSDIIGENFGTTSGIAWGEDMPFYLYAVNLDNTKAGLAFAISRNPIADFAPSATNLGYKGNPAATNSQDNFFFFLGSSPASYAGKACVRIGGIIMTKDSGDDWTGSSTLTDNTIHSKPFVGRWFKMPLGQNGADSNNYLRSGGTAPTWATPSNLKYSYTLNLNGTCSVNFDTTPAGSCTNGSGTGVYIITPYYSKLTSFNLTPERVVTGYFKIGGSGVTLGVIIAPTNNSTDATISNTSGGGYNGSSFTSTFDDVTASFTYPCFIK